MWSPGGWYALRSPESTAGLGEWLLGKVCLGGPNPEDLLGLATSQIPSTWSSRRQGILAPSTSPVPVPTGRLLVTSRATLCPTALCHKPKLRFTVQELAWPFHRQCINGPRSSEFDSRRFPGSLSPQLAYRCSS